MHISLENHGLLQIAPVASKTEIAPDFLLVAAPKWQERNRLREGGRNAVMRRGKSFEDNDLRLASEHLLLLTHAIQLIPLPTPPSNRAELAS